jgi:hypothetical protein
VSGDVYATRLKDALSVLKENGCTVERDTIGAYFVFPPPDTDALVVFCTIGPGWERFDRYLKDDFASVCRKLGLPVERMLARLAELQNQHRETEGGGAKSGGRA